MLLLYQEKKQKPPCPNKFTFHYASTLSGCAFWRRMQGGCIYIPLCFYFIRHRPMSVCREQKYLHSTMLLLYPQHSNVCVYLPHNLHSTMLLLYLHMHPPFYCMKKFTFHYASTLSKPSTRRYLVIC